MNASSADLRSDDRILEELGERLAAARLSLDLTQASLADRAGVSKSTVERMESGHSAQTLNLIRVLRAMGLLAGLDALVPPTGPTPMQLLRRRGKAPKRASGRRARRPSEPWTWGEGDP